MRRSIKRYSRAVKASARRGIRGKSFKYFMKNRNNRSK